VGTIKKRPAPNGPIGWAIIGGERIPVIPDPLWYRQWTEQIDGGKEVLSQSIITDSIASGATTDVVVETLASFSLTADSHIPDGEIYRDNVIEVSYTATRDCSIGLHFSCAYSIDGAAASNTHCYLMGGVYIVGDFASGVDAAQATHVLSAPDYDAVGQLSCTASFSMAAGETKTFAFLAKRVVFNSETTTLSNISLRLEAIKV
jgi:hypothetical protein